jgi:hypothetical protein
MKRWLAVLLNVLMFCACYCAVGCYCPRLLTYKGNVVSTTGDVTITTDQGGASASLPIHLRGTNNVVRD